MDLRLSSWPLRFGISLYNCKGFFFLESLESLVWFIKDLTLFFFFLDFFWIYIVKCQVQLLSSKRLPSQVRWSKFQTLVRLVWAEMGTMESSWVRFLLVIFFFFEICWVFEIQNFKCFLTLVDHLWNSVLLHGDDGEIFFAFVNQAFKDQLMGVVILAPNDQMFWGGGCQCFLFFVFDDDGWCLLKICFQNLKINHSQFHSFLFFLVFVLLDQLEILDLMELYIQI